MVNQPTDRPVTILGILPGGNLNLDPETINVNRGDTVTWIIGPNSQVQSITSINPVAGAPGSIDVFVPGDPKQLGSSSNWRGTVSTDIAAGSKEIYTIQYTRSNGAQGKADPIIQVNA